jgi:hypothetical protein
MYYPVVGNRTPLIFTIIITLTIHHYRTIYINLPARFSSPRFQTMRGDIYIYIYIYIKLFYTETVLKKKKN